MMKATSSRISRKATHSMSETRSSKSDPLGPSPEATPESGVVKSLESMILDPVETSDEVGFSPDLISRLDNSLILNQRNRVNSTQNDAVEFFIKEMQKTRFQMMNASGLEERVKKYLDAMINIIIDDINCVSSKSFKADKHLWAMVIAFYLILFASLWSLFSFWNSDDGNSSSGLTPT